MNELAWKELLESYTKELEEKIQEIKDIIDLEEQDREIIIAKANFGVEGKLGNLKRARPDSIVGYVSYLNEYEKLFKELEDLDGEVSKKLNQEKKNKNRLSKSNKKTDAHSKKQKQFTCAECGEIKKGKYKYNKKQKDGQKFCSDNCYYQHYAETCDNCLEKCISSYQGKANGLSQTYYQDGINKTGTLCSKCHQEKLKEEKEQTKKDQEWEENCKRLDRVTDDLIEGMEETIKGEGEDDSDGDDSTDNPVSNSNANTVNKKNQLQSQQSQLLAQIMQLEQNPTNNQAELEAKRKQLKELQNQEKELNKSLPLSTQISILEREIKRLEQQTTRTPAEESLLATKRKQLAELLRKQNSNANNPDQGNRTMLYIGIGTFGLFTLLLIFILARNRQKTKKY